LPPTPELPTSNAGNRPQGGDWVFKEKYEQLLASRIASERVQGPPAAASNAWEPWVMTTFESVQALWERPYRTWRPEGINPFNHSEPITANEADPQLELDSELLSSQAFDENATGLHEEDQEWAKWLQEQEDADIINEDYDEDPENGPPPEMQWEPPEVTRDQGQLEDRTEPQIKLTSSSANTRLNPTKRSEITIEDGPITSKQPEPEWPLHAHDDYIGRQNKGSIASFDRGKSPDSTHLVATRKAEQSSQQPIEIEDVFFSPTIMNGPENDQNQNMASLQLKSPADALRITVPKEVRFADSLETHASDYWDKSKRGQSAFEYAEPPPPTDSLLASMNDLGIPFKEYRDPFYSKLQDIPEHAREFGGLRFQLYGEELNEWDNESSHSLSRESTPFSNGSSENRDTPEPSLVGEGVTGWEFASAPPPKRKVLEWLNITWKADLMEKQRRAKQSQLEGPTQHGSFISRPKRKETDPEFKSMSIFSLEIFALTSKSAYDPEKDEIVLISWCFHDGSVVDSDEDRRIHYQSGILVVKRPNFELGRLRNSKIGILDSELDIINALVDEVNFLDPDILCGWEVQSGSWGYFITRANSYGECHLEASRAANLTLELGLDAKELLSRAPHKATNGIADNWSTRHTSSIKVSGRHVLNLWRLMRSELTLDFYTFHNVARHVLKQRVPRYTNATLKGWFVRGTPAQQSRVLGYFADMTSMHLEILDEIQIVVKTAEFARVFGIDFFSVLSRGSQFKVESFMLRIAKPESFVLISPSRHQVGMQNAAECFPLIMEPVSAFYKGPLLVLDFQSLYPSVMVAYNYCYSTCLGRVKDFKGKNKFGVLDHLEVPPGLLEKVKDHVHMPQVAPNGMIYVKSMVRKSLLAKMLTELLDTRVMVKQGMQLAKGNKVSKPKRGSNVTYGYTSASFSGRMPAVEIADSIVQAGRETLEKAIHLIDSTVEWGAKVVYGDTDSLFVYLPGKTKQQAFVIGNKISEAVTASNPAPIKLKFEKVYLPSVLVAKKRYVGFKYEDPDEQVPVFDAKGIETVRRDGIPAGQKMMETTLNDKVAPQPGAAIAAERLAEDPNDETQYGERVRYVITRARPGDRLSDRSVPPEVLLFDETGRQLDAYYYVTRRLIPPLARIFDLVGADVRAWFDEMPKPQKIEGQGTVGGVQAVETPPRPTGRFQSTFRNQKIDQHFASNLCLVCENVTSEILCADCRESSPESTIFALQTRTRRAERHLQDCQAVCASCSGCPALEEIRCESLECEWLYERVKAKKEVHKAWREVPAAIEGLLLARQL
ncbi:DNA polymerase zeta, partial [Serendipita sp. 399]